MPSGTGARLHRTLVDVSTPHVLGELEPAVASEAEIDSKIAAHRSNASAHHVKTTDAAEIITGVFADARIPGSVYGVAYDEVADSYERLGSLAGSPLGTSPPNSLIPIQAAMRRCLLRDDGSVAYYCDPADSTLRVGGGAADLTGGDGQVMVEIPLFYYRYRYIGSKHYHEISQTPREGFSPHWAFHKNGEIVPYRYIGAYEGVLWDASAARYTNGLHLTAGSATFAAVDSSIERLGETHPFATLEVGDKIVVSGTAHNNGTKTVASIVSNQKITISEPVTDESAAGVVIETEKDWVNDKLCSVSGKAPINMGTRANFRAVAARRGAGWRQQDYDLVSAIQLLYLIEYADWNSQLMIGNGLTDWTWATWSGYNNHNPIEKTGLSNANGNATVSVSRGNGTAGSYMSYRGIENFFGHVWKWVDGININNNIPYVSNNDTHFADDTLANYLDLGIVLHNVSGWPVTLERIDRGFLPASVGGSSSTFLCDFYWQATGWRVAMIGAAANNGIAAGVVGWNLWNASYRRFRNVSSRLSF